MKTLIILGLSAGTSLLTACGERAENAGTPAQIVVAPEAILPPTTEASRVEATAVSQETASNSGGATADGEQGMPPANGAPSSTEPPDELPLLGETAPAATGTCVLYQNAPVADEELPVVYATPSVQAEALGRLGRNHWANGVSWANGWYEIALASGETGWVWASAVGSNELCASLQPTATDLPIIGLPAAPPATGCVVYQSGQVGDEALPLVYAAPSSNAPQLARFGRNHWADGLQRQGEWIEIVVQAGETGWVHQSGVGLSTGCSMATTPPPPELPMIANRGAPANTRCVVMNLWGPEQPVPVYGDLDAGQQLIATLTGWADVQRLGDTFHEILIPQGGSGWVKASLVNLSVGCGKDGPLRLEFPAGTGSQTLEGKMPAAAQVSFIFWARAGQGAMVRVSSLENSVLFRFEGIRNGEVYKPLLDGENEWQGPLDLDQEYLLILDNAGSTAATYTVELALEN